MSSYPVLRVLSIAGIAAALAMAPLASHGTSIPGGTTSSDDLLVNFDLSNAGLPLPFLDVVVDLFIDSPIAGGGNMSGGGNPVGIVIDVFSDLSGQGSLIRSINTAINANGLIQSQWQFVDAGIRDGLFSLGFRVGPGVPADFNGGVAYGEEIQIGEPGSMQGDRTVRSQQVNGVIVTTSTVPEPATLALIGLGLSGLAFVRWRRTR